MKKETRPDAFSDYDKYWLNLVKNDKLFGITRPDPMNMSKIIYTISSTNPLVPTYMSFDTKELRAKYIKKHNLKVQIL